MDVRPPLFFGVCEIYAILPRLSTSAYGRFSPARNLFASHISLIIKALVPGKELARIGDAQYREQFGS